MTHGSRALELLGLLQRRRCWSGRELADRLGVSPRTLRRDVERLGELGYPVRATPGRHGGYRLEPGASLPPLLVDDEEAVAIVLGLRAAAAGGVAGAAADALRALTTVVAVLPSRLRRTALDLQQAIVARPPERAGAAVDVGTLTTIAAACRDAEVVTLRYTDRRGTSSDRLVEPYAVVPHESRWYLLGYDLDRHDWRTLRLDRCGGTSPTGRRFRRRDIPDGDPGAYVARSVTTVHDGHRIDVVIEAPADRVRAEVAHWGAVTALPDGRSRLVAQVSSFDWVAFVLGALEAPFTVTGPEELIRYLRAWGERFTACTIDRPDPELGSPRVR